MYAAQAFICFPRQRQRRLYRRYAASSVSSALIVTMNLFSNQCTLGPCPRVDVPQENSQPSIADKNNDDKTSINFYTIEVTTENFSLFHKWIRNTVLKHEG